MGAMTTGKGRDRCGEEGYRKTLLKLLYFWCRGTGKHLSVKTQTMGRKEKAGQTQFWAEWTPPPRTYLT